METPPTEYDVHFILRKVKTSLPLGWVLSWAARKNMHEQLGFATEGKLAAEKSLCNDKSQTNQLIGAAAENCIALGKTLKHLGKD